MNDTRKEIPAIAKRRTRRRANGEGTIVQRKDSAGKVVGYMAAATVGAKDGKQARRYFNGKTQALVKQKLDAFRAEQRLGIQAGNHRITLSEHLKRWMQEKRRDLRGTTIQSYEYIITKHIVPTLGAVRLEALKPLDLQGLYAKLSERGLSSRTVGYVHGLLYSALKQAVRWQIVARNVAEAVNPPRQVKHEVATWSGEEVAQFLEAARSDRLYVLFYLALTTGLRRGELLALQWSDVDLNARMLHVRHTLALVKGTVVIQEPKTRSSRRTVAFGADVATTIAALKSPKFFASKHRDQALAADYLFLSENGTPIHPRNLERTFKRILRRAGVREINFHAMRHSHASLLIRRNISPKIVSARLGHSNVGFTLNTYIHLDDDQAREGALVLADLIGETKDEAKITVLTPVVAM